QVEVSGLSPFPSFTNYTHGLIDTSYVFSTNAEILAVSTTPGSKGSKFNFDSPMTTIANAIKVFNLSADACDNMNCWMRISFVTPQPILNHTFFGVATESDSGLMLWPSYSCNFGDIDWSFTYTLSLQTCLSEGMEDNYCYLSSLKTASSLGYNKGMI